MNERHYDLVLLYSGGLDSTLLLEIALEMGLSPLCLLINYGQKHVEELEFAQRICQDKKVPWIRLQIDLPVASNLTSKAQTYEGVSPWHVPSRNLIFVGIAASFAEERNIPLIWYGANYEDRDHLFPDCYQEWIFEMNKLLAINGSKKVMLEAPLSGMHKETVKALAHYFGITNDKVFSGYEKRQE